MRLFEMLRIVFWLVVGGLAVCRAAAPQAQYRVLPRLLGVPGVTQGQYTSGIWIDAVLDADGDGALDLIGLFGGLVVAHGDGRGRFGRWQLQPPIRSSGITSSQAYGDVDGDGDVDIYVAVSGFGDRNVADDIYINDGAGNFTPEGAVRLAPTAFDTSASTLVDVDGDGDLDVVLGGWLTWWVPGGRARNWILLNDGAGRFSLDLSSASLPPDLDDTVGIAAGDLDGDGDMDLVFGNYASSSTIQNQSKVYFNDGSGHFTLVQGFPANLTRSPHLFDMDGDGDLDLAFHPRAVTGRTLFENDGTGRFSDVSARMAGADLRGVGFGDVDGDGDIDVVSVGNPVEIGNGEVRSVFQWVNDGTGRFTDATAATMPTFTERSFWGAYQVANARVADLDLDGDLDVILSDNGNFTPPDNNPILWNMTRHVYAPVSATIGQPYVVDFYGGAGNLVLPAVAFAPARIRLGALGVLGLDPGSLIVGTPLRIGPAGEKASLTLQVPQDPSLVGRKLYWQGLESDAAQPSNFRFTNTFEETIGS